jgi:hypothetical protein
MNKIIFPKPTIFFTEEEKHLVIQDYFSSGRSKDYIWRKYTGKSDHGQLLRWMRDLGYASDTLNLGSYNSPESDFMPQKKEPQDPNGQDFEILQLKKRISELEKRLKEAEIKAIAHSTMVDIAEKEFNIPIRKKFNTKP